MYNNTDAEYIRISTLTIPEIRKELANKSPEWKLQYYKLKRSQSNGKYHANKRIINNTKRREQAKEKREQAVNIKPIIRAEPIPLNVDDIDFTAKREYKNALPIENLTDTTKRLYVNVLKAVYKRFHDGEDIPNDAEIIKYITNTELNFKHNTVKIYKQNIYIIDNIEDIAKSHSAYLPVLYAIFSRFTGAKINKFREVIYPYMSAYNENYHENRANVKVNNELINKINFDVNEITANIAKLDDIYEKIIYALMFLLPTRRLYDYRIMRIASKSGDTQNTAFNWYYRGKLFINNTKNKKTAIFSIPLEIVGLINNLPDDTDYILGKAYSESVLSRLFAKITLTVYGTPYNALDIRKIYASDNLRKAGETGNIAEFVNNAESMGHSVSETLKYAVKR
jgi:hypothetical protein